MGSSFHLFLICGIILPLNAAPTDPEAFMTAPEMIRYWGYPTEIHEVFTKDGYILDLFRIPHGRYSDANSSCVRPLVLMVHGLATSAPEFILNPPDSSPAFLLADAGFDVFLMNFRGSTYSKRHITLNPWDNMFWQFTIDEMARYDVPAVIDKIITITGQHSMYWVGNSQGTITGFMMLSDLPSYNSKVKALFQVGPAGNFVHSKGLFKILFVLYDALKPIVDFYRVVLGSHEVAFGLPFLNRLLIRLCLLIPYLGPQIASHGKVEHMDHSPLENSQRYGQETPTLYNYSNIDVPVHLIWSRNDWATTQEDIEEYLLKNLRKEVVKEGFEVPEYNHLDFVIATDCAEKVWNPIIKIMREQEKNDMCVK